MSQHPDSSCLASSRNRCRHLLTPNWLTALTLFTAGAVSALASEESFDYPAGYTLAAQGGGTGWVDAWGTVGGNGSIVSEDGSLSYPGIVSTGGKMHFVGINGTGTTTTTYRTLDPVLTEGGTYYLRILAQNLNNGHRYFGLGLFSGSTERMLLGQGSTFSNWTINHAAGVSTNNTLQSEVASTNLSLLVLKLELQAGVERMTFWVNPDLSKPEDITKAVGGTSFLTDADFGNITRVRLGGGGYSATAGGNPTEHYLDEISVSTVSPFPLPPPTLTYEVSNGNLTLSWPIEYLGWVLQAQTNAPTAGFPATWSGKDIPGTESVISTTIPLNLDPSVVSFRLRQP